MAEPTLVTPDNVALLTDQYELTMIQAYLAEGMHDAATFDLFVRDLPPSRNYLLACGIDDALDLVQAIRFTDDALDTLRSLGPFDDRLLGYLADFRFTGDVLAVPEGCPVFGDEPIVEVIGPLPEAQLLETVLLNQITFQTNLASKASRVVLAARGRRIVDFGLRRMHGLDAGLKSSRAFRIAGVHATSNVLAGHAYGIPVTGTMAHSYIQAHDCEHEAFRAFAREFGETVLLIDTYDTIAAAHDVCRLAAELGDDFRIRAVRLDSGDLADLARRVRAIFDEAGLTGVGIFASGGLDERKISDMAEADVPIDGFGVGTHMGVADDAPALDSAYKLVEYAGTPRMKLSSGKRTHPGRKQVFRVRDDGHESHDVIAVHDEQVPGGEPLLRPVVRDGRRTGEAAGDLEAARRRSREALDRLPARIRALDPADPPYDVRVSERLRRLGDDLESRLVRERTTLA